MLGIVSLILIIHCSFSYAIGNINTKLENGIENLTNKSYDIKGNINLNFNNSSIDFDLIGKVDSNKKIINMEIGTRIEQIPINTNNIVIIEEGNKHIIISDIKGFEKIELEKNGVENKEKTILKDKKSIGKLMGKENIRIRRNNHTSYIITTNKYRINLSELKDMGKIIENDKPRLKNLNNLHDDMKNMDTLIEKIIEEIVGNSYIDLFIDSQSYIRKIESKIKVNQEIINIEIEIDKYI